MFRMVLIKGRYESLDGNIIIYGKIIDVQQATDSFIAYYFSNDKEYLFNKFPNIKTKIESGVENKLDEISVDKYLIFTKEYALKFLEGKENLIFGDKIKIESDDFSNFTEDIFYAGKHPSMNSFVKNASIDLNSYFMKLIEQASYPVTHQDFFGKPIGLFVKERYADKMLTATRIKDYHIFYRVKDDFLTFSKGSDFEKKAKELCDIIEYFNFDQIDEKLTNTYILTINALHKEDLDTVIRLDKEIKSCLSIKGIKQFNAF
jgi:hypothetical protein